MSATHEYWWRMPESEEWTGPFGSYSEMSKSWAEGENPDMEVEVRPTGTGVIRPRDGDIEI